MLNGSYSLKDTYYCTQMLKFSYKLKHCQDKLAKLYLFK